MMDGIGLWKKASTQLKEIVCFFIYKRKKRMLWLSCLSYLWYKNSKFFFVCNELGKSYIFFLCRCFICVDIFSKQCFRIDIEDVTGYVCVCFGVDTLVRFYILITFMTFFFIINWVCLDVSNQVRLILFFQRLIVFKLVSKFQVIYTFKGYCNTLLVLLCAGTFLVSSSRG